MGLLWQFNSGKSGFSGMPATDVVFAMEADGGEGASAGSQMYQDTAGTTPATVQGQTVGSWLEPITNTLFAANAAGTLEIAAGINGKASFLSSVGMEGTVPGGTVPSSYTLFVVADGSIFAGGGAAIFSSWDVSGIILGTAGWAGSPGGAWQINAGNHANSAASISVFALAVENGVQTAFFQDGVEVTLTPGLSQGPYSGAMGIGRLTPYEGYAFNGRISAIAILSGYHVAGDAGPFDAMQAYLSAKYGT